MLPDQFANLLAVALNQLLLARVVLYSNFLLTSITTDRTAEAQQIAERGPMRLYLADVHLHRARMLRDKAELAKAAKLDEEEIRRLEAYDGRVVRVSVGMLLGLEGVI